MAIRCLRCGGAVEGFSQLCNSCTEAKRASEEQSAAAALEATMTPCPSCEKSISRAALACQYCGTSFVKEKQRTLTGYGVEYGGFWLRFLALFIDGILLGIPNFIIGEVVADQYSAAAMQIAFSLIYTVGFWTVEGATPGKLVLGLRIVDADGNQIGVGQALLRYFGYFLDGVTLGVGYLMIVFSEKKQGLHDQIASTYVVRA
jgi:uncharacterized RDD family membrane protein YckC